MQLKFQILVTSHTFLSKVTSCHLQVVYLILLYIFFFLFKKNYNIDFLIHPVWSSGLWRRNGFPTFTFLSNHFRVKIGFKCTDSFFLSLSRAHQGQWRNPNSEYIHVHCVGRYVSTHRARTTVCGPHKRTHPTHLCVWCTSAIWASASSDMFSINITKTKTQKTKQSGIKWEEEWSCRWRCKNLGMVGSLWCAEIGFDRHWVAETGHLLNSTFR